MLCDTFGIFGKIAWSFSIFDRAHIVVTPVIQQKWRHIYLELIKSINVLLDPFNCDF